MNEQIKRDMRQINYQFLAMAVIACVFGIAVYWGLAVLVRLAVARLLQAL